MTQILGIKLVIGDTFKATYKVWGSATNSLVFSFTTKLGTGYSVQTVGNQPVIQKSGVTVFDPSDYDGISIEYNDTSRRLTVNIAVDNDGNVVLYEAYYNVLIPKELTECFEEGNTTFNISVTESLTDNLFTIVYNRTMQIVKRINSIIGG